MSIEIVILSRIDEDFANIKPCPSCKGRGEIGEWSREMEDMIYRSCMICKGDGDIIDFG